MPMKKPSAIDEFSDSVFSVATEMLAEVSEGVREDIGRSPTVAEMCELLAIAVRTTSPPLFDDSPNSCLLELKAKVKKSPKRWRVAAGDLFAAPAVRFPGKCFLLLYLGEMPGMGSVFGVFDGVFAPRPPVAGGVPQAYPYSIRSDHYGIGSGSWRWLGHLPDLIDCFPAGVAAYYNGILYRERADIGPYGSVRTLLPNGEKSTRDLTKEAAADMGILGNREELDCLSDDLEEFLMLRLPSLSADNAPGG